VLSESADGKVKNDSTETAVSEPLIVASEYEENNSEKNNITNMPIIYSLNGIMPIHIESTLAYQIERSKRKKDKQIL